MKLKRRRRLTAVIPINSMSDIAFLLLIFIMLISLINYRKEIKIDYPEARNFEVVQSDKNFEIWVDVDGNIFHNGNSVTIPQLESLIAQALETNPQTRIHLIADKNTKYKNIDRVVKLLQLLQHRVVSFVVKGD